MFVSKGKGVAFQRRTSNGGPSEHSGATGNAPMWVKLTRTGNTIVGYASSNGTTWVQIGSDTFSMPADMLVGLAVSSHTTSATATGTFDSVSISTQAGGGGDDEPAGTLPSGWLAEDVGVVGVSGGSSLNGGTFTVKGAGADVWGTADAFHFAYRPLSGDGTIVARVAGLTGADAWTKAGVMIRGSLSPSSAQAFMLVSKGKGVAFQRRKTNGGQSVHSGATGAAPMWVKLTRSGSTITAHASSNGTSWVEIGSDTFSMPADVLVGLAVSSHTTAATATGTFDNVSVSAETGGSSALPAGWASEDIGNITADGSAVESGGTTTVKGAGADIWGTADALHFAYRTLSGDGTIVARVASLSGGDPWTKAGVMMRQSLTAGSAHATMLISVGNGVAFQRRPVTGGNSEHTDGGSARAPEFLRLTRSGTTVSAYSSWDGQDWRLIGTDTISLSGDIYVGLAVSSHETGTLATGVFDNVAVSE
jgi:regulation of enolase protein 1 (concanavalin A-like superfamily)